MKITRIPDQNDYAIKGLTLGHIFTILHALDKYSPESVVASDIKTALEKEIDKVKSQP